MISWSVKMECGHWLRRQSTDDKDKILESGQCVCAKCGASSPTGALRLNGLSAKQTERKLSKAANDAELWEEHRRLHTYKHRPDGLVTTPSPPQGFRWWCHECDGKRPDAWRKGKAGTWAEVEAMWSNHKATPGHAERFGYVAALTDERLALAANRVNLTRKPPPPNRRASVDT